MPSPEMLAAILAPVLAAGQSDLAPPAAAVPDMPDAPAVAGLASPAVSPIVETGDRRAQVDPGGGIALRMAWVVSVLVLAALGSAGWVFRADIVAAWPPAQRVFSLGESFRGG